MQDPVFYLTITQIHSMRDPKSTSYKLFVNHGKQVMASDHGSADGAVKEARRELQFFKRANRDSKKPRGFTAIARNVLGDGELT